MRETTTKTGRTSPIQVGIVHQSRIFRECLAKVLSKDDRFQAEPLDGAGRGYRPAIAAADPQVVLIDLNLPEESALELTRHIHDRESGSHVILLTRGASHDGLVECFMAGAHACVPEDSSLEELCDAIEKVAAGRISCSHGIVHSMFHRAAERSGGGSRRIDSGDAAPLTRRELEIVRLIAEHLSNKQIARRLSVSIYTVKNHVANIVEKLDVSGRYEAVDFARQRRWLDPAALPADRAFPADRDG
jgi:DNA-binding NarL/FixJ family response regulator